MKKGFWNYTEPVTYRVVMVRIMPVKQPPMHWQNAVAGTDRQAVEISYGEEKFYIDNGDGSGLLKMFSNGSPGAMSRHLQIGNFSIIAEVPEAEWTQHDPRLRAIDDETINEWQRTNCPEQWEKVQALKRAWAESPMNPRTKKSEG